MEPLSYMAGKIRDLTVSLAISLAVLVLCEFGLRMVFPAKITRTQSEPKPQVAYEPNPDYIVALKPNLRTSFTRHTSNGGQTIPWETNSHAFRGLELEPHPDIRVMVYGDSNIQAEFSLNQDTFAYRLQQYLTKSFAPTHIEVVNAGVVGFGPDQSLIKLSNEAAQYRPDLVILNVFADNDFGDLVRNRLVDLDAGEHLIRTQLRVEKDSAFAIAERNDARPQAVTRFLKSLLLVKAAGKVAGLLRRAAADEIQRDLSAANQEYSAYKKGGPRKFSQFDDHYDSDVSTNPTGEAAVAKVRLMAATLREARKATAARGIQLLVVIEPSATDLTENQVVSYRDLQKYPGYKRENLSALIDSICSREKIARVNLFETFLDNAPDQLYFRTPDNHWNDRGQDLAARVTAAFVAKTMRSTLVSVPRRKHMP